MTSETVLFIVLWFVFPPLWYVGLRLAKISLTMISIPSVLIIFILVTQYIGILLLYFHFDPYRADDINRQDILFDVYIYDALAISCLIFGFLIARGVCKARYSIVSTSRELTFRTNTDMIFSISMLFIGMVVTYQYIAVVGFENIALFSLMDNIDSSASAFLRSQMSNNFEGRYYIYKFFMKDVLSISSFCLFCIYQITKTRSIFLWFLISFMVCVLSNTLTIEKGPLLIYLISLLLCYLLMNKKAHINFSLVGKALIFITVVITSMYMFIMGTESPVEGFLQASSRILTGSVEPLYHYLDMFPEHVDYLYGRSFPNPGGILPFEPYHLTFEVKNFAQPWHSVSGVVGSMPAFFWGELYSNFGPTGIIFGATIVGFLVYVLSHILSLFPNSPFVISVYIWFALHIGELATTSVSNYMADVNAILIALITLIYLFVQGQGVIYIKHNQSLFSPQVIK